MVQPGGHRHGLAAGRPRHHQPVANHPLEPPCRGQHVRQPPRSGNRDRHRDPAALARVASSDPAGDTSVAVRTARASEARTAGPAEDAGVIEDPDLTRGRHAATLACTVAAVPTASLLGVNAPQNDDALADAADWDQMWADLGDDTEDLDAHSATLRWREQARLVDQQFGGFEGLRAIEIGAGRASNAPIYAQRGGRVTVLDPSAVALEQALRRRRPRAGVGCDPGRRLRASGRASRRFDVSMSFGLCEHFLGARRRAVVAAHLELLRPGGIAMVNVPNRFSPIYRLWMGLASDAGRGRSAPRSRSPGRDGRPHPAGGGLPLTPIYVGGLGTLVNQGRTRCSSGSVARVAGPAGPRPRARLPGLRPAGPGRPAALVVAAPWRRSPAEGRGAHRGDLAVVAPGRSGIAPSRGRGAPPGCQGARP